MMIERAFEGFAALPPPAARDHWELLGLPPGTSVEIIKMRFREMAKKAHPDAGGSREQFARLADARDDAIREVEREAMR